MRRLGVGAGSRRSRPAWHSIAACGVTLLVVTACSAEVEVDQAEGAGGDAEMQATETAPLGPEERAVLAVANAALHAITNEDMVALTNLMIDEAISVPTNAQGIGIRTRQYWLDTGISGDIVERGFDPVVRVSGTIASVWYPYDLYLDGEWSHCGVDVFTIALTPDDGWRIVSLAWSAEQPPACEEHPDGPP